MSDDTYKIIRYYRDGHDNEVVETGLTFAEARKHCNDKESSSRTARSDEATARTEKYGAWFDGFTEE